MREKGLRKLRGNTEDVFFWCSVKKLSNYQTNTLVFKQKKYPRVRETQLEVHVFFNPFKSHQF